MRINGIQVDLKRVVERAKASKRIWKDACGTERVLSFPTTLQALELKFFDGSEESNWAVGALNFEAPYKVEDFWATGDNPLPDVVLRDWIVNHERVKELSSKHTIFVYAFVNGSIHPENLWSRSVQPAIDAIELYIVHFLKDKILTTIESEGFKKYGKNDKDAKDKIKDQLKELAPKIELR